MPSSNLLVAPRVLNLVWESRPPDRAVTVLDVGPGWGKYATLLREYVDPQAHITAVEAWAPYVDDHNLEALYDLVIVGDIRDQPDELLSRFDVVLLVDVIEHMPKADGLALLDRIPCWVVISTPRDFFQNPAGLPWTEDHVSHWTIFDFEELDRFDSYDPDLFERLGGIICRLRPK